jgi:hypothetical protein
MATPADATRLQKIRQRHDEASTDWSLSENGLQILARVVPGTPVLVVLNSTDDCGWQDLEFVSHAHDDVAFLLQLLREAFAEIRRLKPPHDQRRQQRQQEQQKPKDHAAECAMKCNEQVFRRYLIEKHGLEDAGDSIRIASRVRSILNIKSRSDLNTDENARQRWLSLRADFEAWRDYA